MGYQRQKFNQIAVRRWRARNPESDLAKRDIEALSKKRLRRLPGGNYRDEIDFRKGLEDAAERRNDTGPLAHDDAEGK